MPFRCNCFVWALRQWIARGGYFAARRSRYGWWPHCFWSEDMVVWQAFEPLHPRRRLLPPPWFRGRVVIGVK